MSKRARILAVIGPGILVAATGVGAGDLATASLTGSELGVAILWVVLLGAGVKFVLNEGLARWQLVSGRSLLGGATLHFGLPVLYLFLLYYLAFSFLVAAALMSACGAAAHAILPLFTPETDKIMYGLIQSGLGLALVRWGGFELFEKVMGACIAFMFVTVTITAVGLIEEIGPVVRGILVPTVPRALDGGIEWTVALMGGVGGTVTILCYGYWIREKGRVDASFLKVCRIDLLVAYLMTALFGLAMVVIGSTVHVEGRGVGLIVALGARLETELGSFGKWTFLLGAWGAIMSSLLGVWQSVPYLFADFIRLLQQKKRAETTSDDVDQRTVDTTGAPYRLFLYGLSTIPAVGLWFGFSRMQKGYAIIGALFLPMLAVCLLVLNGRHLEPRFRNRPVTTVVLWATLLFFLVFFGFVVF